MAFDDIVTNYNNEKTHFRLYDIKITSIDVRNLSIINNFDYRSAITKNSHIQGFESTLREYITSLSEKGIPFDTIEVTGVPHLTVKHNKIMEVMQKVLSGNYSYVTDKSRNDNTYASKRIENLRERYYNFYDCLGDLKIDDTDSLAYYIKDVLGGEIPTNYSEFQGRINSYNGSESTTSTIVISATDATTTSLQTDNIDNPS